MIKTEELYFDKKKASLKKKKSCLATRQLLQMHKNIFFLPKHPRMLVLRKGSGLLREKLLSNSEWTALKKSDCWSCMQTLTSYIAYGGFEGLRRV